MVELPEIIEPQTAYTANMKSLWGRWPALAQQVELVDERDIIECEPTRSGQLTCQLMGAKGSEVYLHSQYDPKRQADQWAQGVIESAEAPQDRESSRIPMCYMVDGFGLGYHVKSLFERLIGDAFIIVSERNIPLIRTALEHLDYSQMLGSGRVILITSSEREEIFSKLQTRSTAMMLGVVFTASLQGQVDGEFHSEVRRTVGEYATFMRSHLVSLMANSVTTCRNILYNLPSYVGTSSVGVLRNRFKDTPAVIVSAGPSLGRNVELLKTIRDNVVVIAVQTTLKPLLAQGIVPDFVTSLDYHEVSRRFFEGLDDLSDVHLVAEAKATWHVIDYYRRRGPVSLLDSKFARGVLKGMEDKHEQLPAGSTVAHLAFYLAEYIGAQPIIFIGQDLAFTDNVYYSPGNALHEVWSGELNRFCTIEMKEWERIARNRHILRKVEDIHGQKIYTDEQMFTYLQQFERDFAKCPVRIIDATQGGARKQNCEVMSLKEAAQRYCLKPVDRKKFDYREKINRFDTSRLKEACQAAGERIKEVEELRDIAAETIEQLDEMVSLVDDQPRLNQKMVRLDELRTKVKYREEIYQLVMHVTQGAEMFRFRRDRALELDGSHGKDLQRRQLKRDVQYVTEVKNGCVRLLDMLRECIARFDEEMENIERVKDGSW
jgi:hypothetical protein